MWHSQTHNTVQVLGIRTEYTSSCILHPTKAGTLLWYIMYFITRTVPYFIEFQIWCYSLKKAVDRRNMQQTILYHYTHTFCSFYDRKQTAPLEWERHDPRWKLFNLWWIVQCENVTNKSKLTFLRENMKIGAKQIFQIQLYLSDF
jgi:hypothetical protein